MIIGEHGLCQPAAAAQTWRDTVGTLALGRRELEHSEEQTYSDTERALLNHSGQLSRALHSPCAGAREHRGLMVTLNEQRKTLQQQQEQLAMRAVEAVQQASKAEKVAGGGPQSACAGVVAG